jgi:hypothetical protein
MRSLLLVESSTGSIDSHVGATYGSQMAVKLSALRTRETVLPRNIIIVIFLVLISVRG